MKKSGRGIIISGGGYRYMTNAWLALRLLRMHGCNLPAELWVTTEEVFPEMHHWLNKVQCKVRVCEIRGQNQLLPKGTRWQWIIKPWALKESQFREILLLDADNFPVKNPEYLFGNPAFVQTGAVF